ncbi:Crp/Fnr family transcriptional regulator [Desulfomicrobium escambiense]|uniref:Crp/Fnr family transcriptional regulator n=1 Tax=Desulfomicrobium escambiense TaxID=29503 RepID=UPI000417212E|nr:Crp/Fnr family transcriptional regulator [Desulfomicrobium escambiense]
MTAEKIDGGLNELEFSRIPSVAECWRKVLSQGRRMKFAKGTHVSPHGSDAGSLYYLERGEIWLLRTTMDGREKIIWAIGPDSLFGETPFFDELPARSAMVAAEDCTVYAFARQCVLSQILPAHPDLMLALFRSLALKVRVLSNQAVSLSLDDLPSRICKYLHLRQPADAPAKGPLVVSPGLNQQDLANLLGVHRVTLNKSLRELEKSGVLGPYSRNEVYVLDRKRFDELVRQNE